MYYLATLLHTTYYLLPTYYYGEVWNNLVVEVAPDASGGGAHEVARWSQWDFLVQDFDSMYCNK